MASCREWYGLVNFLITNSKHTHTHKINKFKKIKRLEQNHWTESVSGGVLHVSSKEAELGVVCQELIMDCRMSSFQSQTEGEEELWKQEVMLNRRPNHS